jgi:hypothetical protein
MPTVVIRLALQDRLVPGASLRERSERARRYGFDALRRPDEVLQVALSYASG